MRILLSTERPRILGPDCDFVTKSEGDFFLAIAICTEKQWTQKIPMNQSINQFQIIYLENIVSRLSLRSEETRTNVLPPPVVA